MDNALTTVQRPPREKKQRVRIVRRPLHGVLLLDKPLGLSSNDAVQRAKWLLRAEKAGHTGTLDPLATGVLPLCFGAATKFSQVQLDAVKSYVAGVKLGVKTSTGDREGDVINTREVPSNDPALKQPLDKALWRACEQLMGAIKQIPPMTSALKRDGKPLYELARAGIEVEREARDVFIHALRFEMTGADTLDLHVICSKGTYIRTLAEDLGELVGCGAHLQSLRRVATGGFKINQCITLEALEAMDEAARQSVLLPVDSLIQDFVRVDLDESDAGKFLSGMRRKVALADAEQVRVYQGSSLLGAAHIKAGELIPTRLLSPIEVEQSLRGAAA